MLSAATVCTPVPEPPLPSVVAGGARFRVCDVCRGAAAPGHRICWSCHVVRRQLGGLLTRAVPVSLFAPGSPLQEMLVAYKAAPSRTARRERHTWLAGLLGEFLSLHLPCLAGPATMADPVVLAIPVPSSSSPRPSWAGEHPLVGLVGAAVANEPRLEVAALLVRWP